MRMEEFTRLLEQDIFQSFSADDLHTGALCARIDARVKKGVAEAFAECAEQGREAVIRAAFDKCAKFPRSDSEFLKGSDFLRDMIRQDRTVTREQLLPRVA
jgi:hypothetical protein